jgi:hypothetical protein
MLLLKAAEHKHIQADSIHTMNEAIAIQKLCDKNQQIKITKLLKCRITTVSE